MFLVFAPVPYVDASSSSAFHSKTRRMLVSAAGMLVELFLAALAMYVWVLVEPGTVRSIAFNVMLIAGVSTVLINGNPLMRYDGYFILCDWIEIPNLAKRGQRYLTYLSDRYLLGAKEVMPPDETFSEKLWLANYTVISWCYRMFIMVTILLFIAGKFFIIGVVLALWAAFNMFVVPIWKAGKHLLESSALHLYRSRILKSVMLFVVTVIVFMAVVPLPLRTQAEGVIWLKEPALVRAGADGFFDQWYVNSGQSLQSGVPLMVLSDPMLNAEKMLAEAKVEEAFSKYYIQQFKDSAEAGLLFEKLEYEQKALQRINERYQLLTVSSEINGRLVIQNPDDMPGRYFKKGELLAYLMNARHMIARVAVSQDDVDLVRSRLQSIELRFVGDVESSYSVKLLREVPGASDKLPSPALGRNGGGELVTDPSDQEGTKVLSPVFIFDLSLPENISTDMFGSRVYVRFEHGPEPLGSQLYRRLRQLFLSRFNA